MTCPCYLCNCEYHQPNITQAVQDDHGNPLKMGSEVFVWNQLIGRVVYTGPPVVPAGEGRKCDQLYVAVQFTKKVFQKRLSDIQQRAAFKCPHSHRVFVTPNETRSLRVKKRPPSEDGHDHTVTTIPRVYGNPMFPSWDAISRNRRLMREQYPQLYVQIYGFTLPHLHPGNSPVASHHQSRSSSRAVSRMSSNSAGKKRSSRSPSHGASNFQPMSDPPSSVAEDNNTKAEDRAPVEEPLWENSPPPHHRKDDDEVRAMFRDDPKARQLFETYRKLEAGRRLGARERQQETTLQNA